MYRDMIADRRWGLYNYCTLSCLFSGSSTTRLTDMEVLPLSGWQAGMLPPRQNVYLQVLRNAAKPPFHDVRPRILFLLQLTIHSDVQRTVLLSEKDDDQYYLPTISSDTGGKWAAHHIRKISGSAIESIGGSMDDWRRYCSTWVEVLCIRVTGRWEGGLFDNL